MQDQDSPVFDEGGGNGVDGRIIRSRISLQVQIHYIYIYVRPSMLTLCMDVVRRQ